MFCPNCGALLPDDAVFCINCRTRVTGTHSALQNQKVQPEVEMPASDPVKNISTLSAPEAAAAVPKPSKKKLWVSLLCIAAALLLAGGGTGVFIWMSNSTPTAENIDTTKYNPDNFTLLLEAGEYQKAVDMYLKTAYGNTEREFELKDRISDFLQEAVDGYWDDSIDYNTAESRFTTVEQVVENSSGTISWSQFAGQKQEFEEADASKVAYDSGCNLMNSGNYVAAITEFSKVAAEDCNYEDAQEQLNFAKTEYQDQMVSTAQSYIDSGDYISASATIEEALTVLPESSELLTLQTTCQAGYISSVLAQADAVFVTPATDWEAAINVLLPAMQQYPDDSQLQQRYDYYMEYQPVSIFDLEPYTHGNHKLSTYQNMADNMGNTYGTSFITYSLSSSETYDIGAQYNRLQGTVALNKSSAGSRYLGYLRIYGDERLLYEQEINGSFKPQQVDIDITGVTDLKIEMDASMYLGVLFSDVTLQKTVK